VQTEANRQRVVPKHPQSSRRVKLLARGLYHGGGLRVLQKVSQAYELRTVSKGVLPRWRRVASPKFVILCYHRVGTGGVPLYSSLATTVFEAQMRFLRKRYRIVSLDRLCEELQDPESVEQSVAVTFDDGYRGLYTEAFPILQKYGIPATIFATVSAMETGEVLWYDRIFLALNVAPAGVLTLELDRLRRFNLLSPAARFCSALEIVQCLRQLSDVRRKECCAELEKKIALPQEELADRMLTWEQIRTMHRAGIAFGSHTLTHPVISQLTPTEMERELGESKQILEEKLDSPVCDFAFPFGHPADCGAAAGEVLARCGYRSAATTIWGVNVPGANPYQLRRVQIGEEGSLALFAFRLCQLFLTAAGDEQRKESMALAASVREGSRRCRSEEFAD